MPVASGEEIRDRGQILLLIDTKATLYVDFHG